MEVRTSTILGFNTLFGTKILISLLCLVMTFALVFMDYAIFTDDTPHNSIVWTVTFTLILVFSALCLFNNLSCYLIIRRRKANWVPTPPPKHWKDIETDYNLDSKYDWEKVL